MCRLADMCRTSSSLARSWSMVKSGTWSASVCLHVATTKCAKGKSRVRGSGVAHWTRPLFFFSLSLPYFGSVDLI